MKIAEFTVYGTPQPQGALRIVKCKDGRRILGNRDKGKLTSWRQECAATALEHCSSPLESKVPLWVTARFFFAKPKSAKKEASWKTTRPDLDKLARSLGDALTGIIWADDSQIALLDVRKGFGVPERVEISVATL